MTKTKVTLFPKESRLVLGWQFRTSWFEWSSPQDDEIHLQLLETVLTHQVHWVESKQ